MESFRDHRAQLFPQHCHSHQDVPGAGGEGAQPGHGGCHPRSPHCPACPRQAGSLPREGQKAAENKQTAGVNGAAVIFGLEGVHTLCVVLANSCKWSWRCRSGLGAGWLRAPARAGLVALVLTGNRALTSLRTSPASLLLSPHPSEATSEGSRGGSRGPWEGGPGLCPRREGTALQPARRAEAGPGWPQGHRKSRAAIAVATHQGCSVSASPWPTSPRRKAASCGDASCRTARISNALPGTPGPLHVLRCKFKHFLHNCFFLKSNYTAGCLG